MESSVLLVSFSICIFFFAEKTTSLKEGCKYSEIGSKRIKCFNGNAQIFDLNELAAENTSCIIQDTETVVCSKSLWIHITDSTNQLKQLFRTKRGFFSDLLDFVECVFLCLFEGREDSHRDTIPPKLDCITQLSVTAEPFQTYAKVSWPTPTAHDHEDGERRLYQVSGIPNGRHFPEGRNEVIYAAKDSYGNQGTCTITIIVTVIRCPSPRHISNGYFQCYPGEHHVLSSWCTVGCYAGFELSHPQASHVVCRRNGQWSHPFPRCIPLRCRPPEEIDNADIKCTDGFNFRSVCTYNCRTGFDVPPHISKTIVCSNNKKWRGNGHVKCVDVERPIMTNCPSTVVAGTNIGSNFTEVSWYEPDVVDNSGEHITPVIEIGVQPGSRLEAGAYDIVYSATDSGGNKAKLCKFNVIVRDVRCPRLYPTPYVHFICPNGYRTGFGCSVRCDPGKTIKGAKYVQCLQSSEGMYGEWQWKDNKQTTCVDMTHCPPIKPPSDGAIACDNWLGGEFCQPQCHNGTDMASVDLQQLYVCEKNGSWFPAPELKTCIAPRPLNVHVYSSASGYFSGDCFDTVTQEIIQMNFIKILNSSLYQREVCSEAEECKPGNVQIACGKTERERRETNTSHLIILHLTLPVLIEIGDIDGVVRGKINRMLNVSMKIAEEVFNASFGTPNYFNTEFTEHESSFVCPEGSVQSKRSFDCVDCPDGSYFDKTLQTCEACKQGTYQDRHGATYCMQCPHGKSTKWKGSVNVSECEDACPPGSFSQSGLPPCSPCEVGYYQHLYGQSSCQECDGSLSTLTVGASSILDCDEFDIQFPLANESSVVSDLSEAIDLSEFTLNFWIRNDKYYENSTLTIYLQDNMGENLLSFSLLRTYTNGSNDNVIILPDNRWNQLTVNYENCTAVTYINNLQTTEIPMECNLLNVTSVSLQSDDGFIGGITGVNLWNYTNRDVIILRCHSNLTGNVLKWKHFEKAMMIGPAVHKIPSECDDFDNCVSSPCYQGKCFDELHDFNCQCFEGFSGKRCDVNIDDCITNICMNGGTCVDGLMNYTCSCGPNYTGEFCEILVVHGAWSTWSNWSECTTTCGDGIRVRKRSCTNPSPDNGGDLCGGEFVDISPCNNTECSVCKTLSAPVNGLVECTNSSAELNCTISCKEGYDFDIEPLPYYYCGPKSFHEWGFETEENPNRRMPKCTKTRMPDSMSATFEVSYDNLSCEEDRGIQIHTLVTEKIQNIVDTLPCGDEKLCSIDVTNINSCEYLKRDMQSTNGIGIVITISTKPSKDNGTETLTDFQHALESLSNHATNGGFTVSNRQEIYKLNLSTAGFTGKLQCDIGMTRVKYLCVPCGKGSYLFGKTCTFCKRGTYQGSEGQTNCFACPDGLTTEGIGAVSINECLVTVQVGFPTETKVAALVGGIVSSTVVVVGILIIIVYKCRKMRTQIEKRRDSELYTSKDILGVTNHVFTVKGGNVERDCNETSA